MLDALIGSIFETPVSNYYIIVAAVVANPVNSSKTWLHYANFC